MGATAILIPALNCAATIGAVVAGARQYAGDVLVVDDGSTDDTAALAGAAGALVARHTRTRGKGAALLTGMRQLAMRGCTGVLTMDGDGQHLSDQIPVLLAAAQREPQALLIGARQLEPGAVAPLRLFGNRFANRWVRIACGQALADTQSGFRVYPLRETLALPLRARHFGFETEVLIRAARAGIALRSVPVRAFYPPRGAHTSHFRPVVDTLRIIGIVLALIFRVW